MGEVLDLIRVMLAALVGTGVVVRLFVPRAELAGSGLLLAGQVGMLATVLPGPLHTPLVALPLAIVGTAALLGIAHLLRSRFPDRHIGWLVVAAAALLPLRVPFELDGERYNLLLPLYAAIAVAWACLLLDDYAVRNRGRHGSPLGGRSLDVGISVFVLLACLSVSWSVDLEASAIKIALVYAPFAMLYVLAREWVPQVGGAVLRRATGAFVGVMAVAAAIGIWQHATETIWQNGKVMVANTFAPDFRTNSIFWDPNIYGRYLVAAALAGLVALCVASALPRVRARVGTLLVLAMIGVGLWYSYSQSSFVALAVAAAVLAFLMLPRSGRAALVVVLLAGLVALPAGVRELQGRDEESRKDVATRGLTLAAERPVAGVGVGAFEHGVRKVAERRGERSPRQANSHTTPITVLAEMGVLGAAAWLLVLTAALATCVAGASARRATALGRAGGASPALAWWAGATFAAVTAHSMFYAGFFEDPLVWLCAGALAATAAAAATATAAADGGAPSAHIGGDASTSATAVAMHDEPGV